MTEAQEQRLLRRFRADLTDDDLRSSATLQSVEDLVPLIVKLGHDKDEIRSILDLGCGYGALASIIGEYLDAEEVYGIDTDDERREIAESRGVRTYDLDLERDQFPFENGSVDLVMSFGVLEHLKFYDNAIEESARVLRDEGKILVSIPNLASWINRLALLLGNQPRDVEISRERAFGISRFYPDRNFLNHVHSATYSAFVELLSYYGFEELDVVGLHPYQEFLAVELIDRLVSGRPSLCRRIAVLGEKRP